MDGIGCWLEPGVWLLMEWIVYSMGCCLESGKGVAPVQEALLSAFVDEVVRFSLAPLVVRS